MSGVSTVSSEDRSTRKEGGTSLVDGDEGSAAPPGCDIPPASVVSDDVVPPLPPAGTAVRAIEVSPMVVSPMVVLWDTVVFVGGGIIESSPEGEHKREAVTLVGLGIEMKSQLLLG